MVDEEYPGPERRSDNELRNIIDRAACAGAEKAIQRMGDLTPYDLGTKEGREGLRSTIRHASELRIGLEAARDITGRAVVKAVVWFSILSIIVGGLYLLGVNPEKIKPFKGLK